jgi:RimJ/RimL family protein N-acetyltransferase
MRFETPRLILRPYDPDDDNDVADACAMYADPEVVRYLSGQVVPDFETQRARLRDRRDFYAALNNRTGTWAIAARNTGRVVGTVMLKQLPRSAPDFVIGDDASRPFLPTTRAADLTDDYEVGWHLARALGQGLRHRSRPPPAAVRVRRAETRRDLRRGEPGKRRFHSRHPAPGNDPARPHPQVLQRRGRALPATPAGPCRLIRGTPATLNPFLMPRPWCEHTVSVESPPHE